MARRPTHLHPIALAALLVLHGAAAAQAVVTITGRSEAVADVSGFGDRLSRAPLQATVLDTGSLRDGGVVSLAGITQADAGVTDAYNAAGYWSLLAVRGFVIDPRANYRRDGLPINAETALSLVNKERVEVLKGTSGIQAGTSAPGGLVNLVVKRPLADLREVWLGWSEKGTLDAALDVSQRLGAERRFGVRINAEAATLRPVIRQSDGERRLLAVAADWLVTPDARLEFEIESSPQSQPSVPGFSLLGDRLPDARTIDPRTNLNNQPWSLPVVLDGDTASLRWQQQLSADWSLQLHGASQRLRSDDRVAFPFGCSNEADYLADRYCADGSYDLYDFRSDGERRRTDALDLQVQGRVRTGTLQHRLTAGAQLSRVHDRYQRVANNYVGSGTIAADVMTAADPTLTDENTNRDERNRELYLRDALQLGERWQLWAGLRHSRIHRESARTDGSRAVDYTQVFTVPWLALGFAPAPGTLAYASWGQGVESEAVPNRARYVNGGQVLPALKSRQVEAGIKLATGATESSATLFDIRRPVSSDLCVAADACVNDERYERRIDGVARHRGLELATSLHGGPWTARASAMWLHARRQGSADPALDGQRPVNVPDRSLKLQVARDLGAGMTVQAEVLHEGARAVLPDNSVMMGGWTRVDAAFDWRLPVTGMDTRVRLAVDNLADRRAWRESPYQFGHVYLMPMPPRTWRVALNASF